MKAVSSVVIFGDPGISICSSISLGTFAGPLISQTDSSQGVENVDADKVLVVCHKGDDICQFGDLVKLEHLTYAQDADTAADFVLSKATF